MTFRHHCDTDITATRTLDEDVQLSLNFGGGIFDYGEGVSANAYGLRDSGCIRLQDARGAISNRVRLSG
jgi:hypothetical protein